VSDSRLVGAAVPIVFSDGTELLLAPLNDKDIFELDEWMQSQVVRAAVEGCRDMDEATQDRVIKIAVREASGVSLMNGRGAQQIGTIPGVSRLVWQMARGQHPELKIEDVRRHMFDPANVRESYRKFHELNRVELPPTKEAPDESKKGSPRKRRSIERSQTRRAGRSKRSPA
jgi:hypothetical protein